MPSKLITKLKGQHRKLLGIFDQITEQSSSDGNQIRYFRASRDAHIALAVHLALEDDELYPKLEKIKESGARATGRKFSKEMLQISKKAYGFFAKYTGISIFALMETREFAKDLEDVIGAVRKRLETEEKVLYPLYEKYYPDD